LNIVFPPPIGEVRACPNAYPINEIPPVVRVYPVAVAEAVWAAVGVRRAKCTNSCVEVSRHGLAHLVSLWDRPIIAKQGFLSLSPR